MNHRPASDRQVELLTRLVTERVVDPALATDLDAARAAYRAGTFTTTAASSLIERLFASRRKDADAPAANAEPGFYMRGDQAIKVQSNKAKTGTYALTWTGHSWEYAPGVGRTLAGLTPMTAAQAAALGLASGRCINCCRTLGGESLSAKVSAVIGYGETCANNNAWSYPKGAKAQREFLAHHAPMGVSA